MKYLLVLLISVSGIHSAAVAAESGGSCSKLFQGSANPAEALDRLSKLPPLLLDLANPREALRRLIEEIVELRTDFITLKGIKESLSDPNSDLNSIRDVLNQLASSYAAEALELLNSKSSFSEKERKILEGYKILIKSALQLKNEIDSIEQERQRQKEEQSQNQQNQENQSQQQKNSDQKNDQQKNQQQKQDPQNNQGKDHKKEEQPKDLRDLQERLDQLRKELDKQSEQKDSKDQNQQDQNKNSQDKQPDQKDSKPKSEEDMIKELEKQVQDLEKRLEQEEQKPQSDKKQQSQKQDQKSQKQDSQNQDKQSQHQDGQKQENQESQGEQKESQENQSQDKESQQQKENSQSKEEQQKQREEAVEKLKEKLEELKKDLEKKQKQKEEQQKNGEKQDSKEESKEESQEQSDQQQDGQKQDGQKQESQKQDQQGQEGQEGQGQQKSQQQGQQQGQGQGQGQKSEQQGQEGQQSQESGEGQSQSQSQSQSQKDSQSQSKESSEQSKSSGKGESSLSPLEKLSEMLKSLRDDKDEKEGTPSQEEKKPSEQETKNAEKEINEQDLKDQKQDSQRKKPRSLKDPKEIKSLDDVKKMEALKHHLDMLWIETIRKYENREDLMASISYFQNTCRKLSAQYRADFLKRYAELASDLYEKLDTYQVEYKNLEQLGLSMISTLTDTNTGVQRKLKYINEVLGTLEKLTSLTPEEDRVLQAVRKLLNHTESKERSVEDKELGEMFLSQMVGPLSKSTLRKQFPSKDPKEEMDWKLFAQVIRNGGLNDLLLNTRAKQLLNIFNKNILKPKFYKKNEGPEVPINEADPELEMARELDRAQRFYRDGAPPKDDLIKLLSGDMLESTYKDEVQRSDPKTPVPKIVTIMVYDVSGSMKSNDKYVLRNALMNSYLDKSQIEVIQGRAEHVVYMIAFDGTAHEAERVGTVQQAQKYFEEARGKSAGSGGSTDITGALVSVYEKIAKHQKEGGELDRANILLITDAEDRIQLDKVAEARKLVSPEVEVVLNAITLGDNNADVQKLVRPENSKSDRAIHQHIPHDQLQKLLEVNKKLVSLLDEAKSFNKDIDGAFSNQTLLVLKNYLSGLATKNAMKDNASAVGTQYTLRQLETKSTNESVDVAQAMEVFVDMTMGPLARNWSAAKKASVLEQYISKVAKMYDVDVDSIYLQMPENLKSQLLRWLQN